MRFDRSLVRFSGLFFLAAFILLVVLVQAASAQPATIPALSPALLVQNADPTPSTMSTFLQVMLVPLFGVIVAALGFLATYLKNRSSVESTTAGVKVAEALAVKAVSIMESVVAGLQAKIVEPLLEASSDGTLTEAEKAKLRDAAVSVFVGALGSSFKTELLNGLGISEAGLATMASGWAEKAVSELKVKTARESAVKAQAQSIAAQANKLTAASSGLLLFILLCLAPIMMTACPSIPVRREVCTSYIACALTVDTQGAMIVESTYGTNSACWSADDRQGRACVEACEAGIASLLTNGISCPVYPIAAVPAGPTPVSP
jgi:hypothetical protein